MQGISVHVQMVMGMDTAKTSLTLETDIITWSTPDITIPLQAWVTVISSVIVTVVAKTISTHTQ